MRRTAETVPNKSMFLHLLAYISKTFFQQAEFLFPFLLFDITKHPENWIIQAFFFIFELLAMTASTFKFGEIRNTK